MLEISSIYYILSCTKTVSRSGIRNYSSWRTVESLSGASRTFVIAFRQFLAPSITNSSSSSSSSLYLTFYVLVFSEF